MGPRKVIVWMSRRKSEARRKRCSLPYHARMSERAPANPTRRSVLTIGNYDGLHLGHAAILAQARRLADAQDAQVVAITFDPPPLQVLHPGAQPPRIMPTDSRVAMLRQLGADRVVLLEPTPDLLAQSPEAFVDEMLRRHQPIAFVEGPGFRFGKGRAGDMQHLATLGQTRGFVAMTVPRLDATLSDRQTVPISSSLVRWLVGRGRVHDADTCLGRPFELTAKVVRGEQRGRNLGVPTANLDPAHLDGFIIPADGVYAAHAIIEPTDQPASRPIPAAVSIGVKPTFGKKQLTVEAHLLDTDRDLYGQTITLRFARWLRDQYAFPGIESLLAQLHRDIELTRLLTAHPATTP